ncbi:Zn-dependent protease with chaperone function [Bryocella elongata]|uniref:Zn-dependent protease with chaperone function n=1 Tax=Bryocella elongata TaxID=863522 RepID=A0A1H5Y5U8_9BACT|nr:M48 family metalloprotease [Bryocella elongata]SEG19351.1 Zn-dependent protease with chaperone function [Bryocella elongata]
MGFLGRTLAVLLVLYGLVFVVADLALLHADAPLWVGFAFAVAFIGLQYVAAPWLIERVFSIDFSADAMPAAQREFIESLCKQRGIPVPRMGVIYSGTPNAFAFGRLRRDARIVVTEGLLKICSEEEANAVLAHELGHIAHYDFAVMTLGALAPLLLYQVYVWTRSVSNLRIVSYAAYVSYWVGQFLVMFLSRTREYGADHFSAEVTRTPSALSSALMKIAYGMVKERSEALEAKADKGASKDTKKDAERSLQLGTQLGLMGISAASGGEALMLATNADEAARVMRWDLVNPWAKVYELNSTHPLTALRLKALNKEAVKLGQEPAYPLPEDARKVNWVGFPIEFVVWALPYALGFLLLSYAWVGRKLPLDLPEKTLPLMVIALGATWAVRIAYRYHGSFKAAKVQDLLEDVTVSQMRPRAVQIEGEVIGNGVPGAFWSPDLVLQDDSGMMYLLYRSSVPLGRLFFAMTSVNRLIGNRVTVQGWYRRGLKPYVEMARVEAKVVKNSGSGMITLFGKREDGSEAPVEYETLVERSYSRWIQTAAAGACVAGGVIWLLNVV